MKRRYGFVSNSSSSSFLCSACGEIESGFDMGLSECEMFECEHGHYIHELCANLDEEGKKRLCDDDEDDSRRYGFPSKYCPVCQFKAINDKDALSYLLHKHGISKDDILKEMAGKYKEMKEFYEERNKK